MTLRLNVSTLIFRFRFFLIILQLFPQPTSLTRDEGVKGGKLSSNILWRLGSNSDSWKFTMFIMAPSFLKFKSVSVMAPSGFTWKYVTRQIHILICLLIRGEI